MDALRNIAKSALLLFSGTVAASLIGLLYRALIARLGPEDYGLYSLGLAVLGIGSLLASAGLLNGIVRFISFYRGIGNEKEIEKVISTALKTTFFLSLAIAALMWIFSYEIAVGLFKNTRLELLIKIFAIAVPFYTLTEVFMTITEAYKKIIYRVLTSHIATNMIKLALTFIFLLLSFKLFGAVAAFVIATMAGCWISYKFVRKVYRGKIRITGFELHRELYSYSWPLFLSKFFNSIYSWTDSFLLGVLMTASNVGIYNAALPLAVMMRVVPTSVLSIYLPTISEMHAKKQSISGIYKTVTRWILMITAPSAALLIIFSHKLIIVGFGKQYGEAATPLVILTAGFFVYSVLQPSGDILSIHKKTKTLFAVMVFATVANVLLNLALIPKYGITGAAIATAASYASLHASTLLLSLKHERTFPLDFNSLKIVLTAAALGLLAYFAAGIMKPTLINTAVVCLIYAGIYIALLRLLKCITAEDIKVLISSMKTKSVKNHQSETGGMKR